jgi:hypothetical protein
MDAHDDKEQTTKTAKIATTILLLLLLLYYNKLKYCWLAGTLTFQLSPPSLITSHHRHIII